MNTRTLSIAISFLFTLIASIGMSDPVKGADAKDQSEIEYIDRTLEVEGQEYKWTIMIPPSAKKGGSGLLFLHGLGETGDNGKSHLKVGLPPAVEQNPEAWPFILIVPQKPTRSDWDFHESAVIEMLDQAIEEGFVDPDKLAITGLSQGGHGTMSIAANHPERFVAAAPICGYAQIAFDEKGDSVPLPSMSEYRILMLDVAEKIKDIPIWLFHGENDSAVPVLSSRAMNHTLESVGADVKYTEFPGVDHDSWDPAYEMKELADWFIEHTQE